MCTPSSPCATSSTAIAAIATEKSASHLTTRRNRRSVVARGLGCGSGRGMRFPLIAGRETIKLSSNRSGSRKMTIQAILGSKGRDVATIGPDERMSQAVATLGEKRIGALPVITDGRVLGILSERD